MDRFLKSMAAWALAAALAAPAAAQSAWVSAQSRPGQTPADNPSCTPQGGYATPDENILREQKDKGILDQLCRNLQLKFSKDFDLGGFGFGAMTSYARQLKQLPCGRQGLLETVHVDAHLSKGIVLKQFSAGNVNLGVSAYVSGESTVMRPLEGTQTCELLPNLIKDFKVAYPVTGERIAGMKVGELWALPLRLTIGDAPGAAAGRAFEEGRSLSSSLTFGGYADDGATSVTLYRLSEKQIRFRFRVENVEVRTPHAVNVVYNFPAITVASQGGKLRQFFAQETTSQLTRYIDLVVSQSKTDNDGNKIVLELLLDADDQEQMEGLSELIRGDMLQLFKLLVREGDLLPDHGFIPAKLKRRDPEELKQRYAKTKPHGVSTVSNKFTSETDAFRLKVPLFFQGTWSDASSQDSLTKVELGREGTRIYRAAKATSKNYFDLPILGPLVRENENRTAEVLVSNDESLGGTTQPRVVYLQQNAFWRITREGVRSTADDMARMTSMIGAERLDGPDSRARVPALELIPASAAHLANVERGQVAEQGTKTGILTLALAVAPEAVQNMINAGPDALLRAYGRTLDFTDRLTVQNIAAAGFTKDAIYREARASSEAMMSVVDTGYFVRLAEQATSLLADVSSVRSAATNDEQAKALAFILGGNGASKMGYEKMLGVLLQFVDLPDTKGDFKIDADLGGGVKVRHALELNGGIDADPYVRYVGAQRAPFASRPATTD
jgi:hypothetical protein